MTVIDCMPRAGLPECLAFLYATLSLSDFRISFLTREFDCNYIHLQLGLGRRDIFTLQSPSPQT